MGVKEIILAAFATEGTAKLRRVESSVPVIGARTARNLAYLGTIFPPLEKRATKFSKSMMRLAEQDTKKRKKRE